ncbi:protein of unknown function [Candidatus Methylopumilus planktonicus]|uniref:Uncharacterized protein n=1 Tax=Candidatus Methylopumilus planktonicus TaxID=1581557 RepID=A0A0D6EUX2_9PROT|nr:protein of unknown function [Candidatus Methylopumilus planktonicus]
MLHFLPFTTNIILNAVRKVRYIQLSAYSLIKVGASENSIGFGFGIKNIYVKRAKKGNTQYGRFLLIAWYLIQ